MRREVNMTRLSNSALQHASSGWGIAIQTGIPEHAPVFQPVMHRQALPAIADRRDWFDDEYREAYMEACVEQNIAWQIKFNRQKREMGQSELAHLIGTKQSAISRLEDPSYGKLNLKSIVKIAHAFKCALSVKLISYSELAEEAQSFSKESVVVKSFEEEIQLIRGDNI